MLLRDPDLANAVDLARRWGDELDAKLLTFIRASQRRARLQQQLTVVAAAIFGLLAIGAAIAAQQAFQQQRIANEQRDRATTQEARAKEARDRALTIQSRLLAERAGRLSDQGDTLTAILLSLEAFRPADDQGQERYEPAAEKSLADAVYRHVLLGIIRDPTTDYVDADFTNDGTMLVAARADGTVEFRSLDAEGRPGGKVDMPADFGSEKKVSVDPKRPILVLLQSDETYFAWNFQTRQAVPGVQGTCNDDDTRTQFVFDPAGERLFVYCDGVRIFDLSTGRVINKPGPYARFALAGDGGRFVTRRANAPVIEVWNARTGALVKSWKPEAADGLAVSSDGEVVLTTTYSGVQFWKATTGTALKRALVSSQARTFDVEASPIGDFFVTHADDGSKVWSLSKDGAILQTGAIAHFLPNGMLAASDGKAITLWDFVTEGHTGTSEGVRRAVLVADDNHHIVAKTVDGAKLITLTKSGDLYVWQTGYPMLLQERSRIQRYLGTVVLTDDGKTIVDTSNGEGQLVFWNADTLAETRRLKFPGNGEVSWLRLTPNGQRVVLGALPTHPTQNAAFEYEVIDVPSGNRLFPAAGKTQASQIDLSADGEHVVSVEGQGVTLWRLSDNTPEKQCPVSPNAIKTAIFGANADAAFAADDKNVVWRVDLKTCAPSQILSFTEDQIKELNLVYRSGILAAHANWHTTSDSSPSARMKLWSELEKKQTLEYISTDWNPFALVADARAIVAEAGLDKLIHVYDVMQGQEVLSFQYFANSDWLTAGIGLAPDATRLFTAWDQRGVSGLRIWRMFRSIDELRDFARATVPECLWPETRNELGLDDAPPRWCIELAKPPYDTPQWRQWLADKDAGREAAMPSQ
jgi:WD40 repeat protein